MMREGALTSLLATLTIFLAFTGSHGSNNFGLSKLFNIFKEIELNVEKETGEWTANVDGAWAAWGAWSPCSVTCVPGGYHTRTRTRTCSNPAPQGGGAQCSGGDTERKACKSCTAEDENYVKVEHVPPKMTYESAFRECGDRNMILPEPRTEALERQLLLFLRKHRIGDFIWIGASDNYLKTYLLWESDKEPVYLNRRHYIKYNGPLALNCGVMALPWGSYQGRPFNIKCDNHIRALICQKNKPGSPRQ